MDTYLLKIKVFQAAITGVVKENHYQHNFCFGHSGGTMILSLVNQPYSIFCHHGIKKLAEIVCHTKYFNNFVFGDHSDFCL
ncbi:hypothetical protein IX321_002806 [Bacteroides pyogenes]|nr:hypothetical protein [Bacteroides pyogenes]MBR8709978.1 hypothetical protein [Bacteroides pyogenes]MBR8718882.1 hypothetical protein [Bacteroides pyogenes]MBR8748342.1 hypothetical protein [Bacteroides pyogenes]MBR8758622.1 hypothetical protein [Bacteroides pyogenes]